MRYDNIKIGPCWITEIKVEPNKVNGNIVAKSSFTCNKSVLALLVGELDLLNVGHKHCIIGSRRDHKYQVKGLCSDTKVLIGTDTGDEPMWVTSLESIENDLAVETAGHYTFIGVEVKSIEPSTGIRIVSFEAVEVESDGTVVADRSGV